VRATPTVSESIAGVGSFAIVLASLFVLVTRVGRPTPVAPFDRDDEHQWDLVDWERDQLQAIGKALAATAVGFLSTVITAVLKDEIAADVPGVARLLR
jgi:hypothetical protein